MRKPPGSASRRDEIDARAAAWLALRDEGFSPKQQAEFEAWRRADLRHEQAIVRLDRAWRSLGRLGTLDREQRETLARQFLQEDPNKVVRGRFAVQLAFSAVAVAVLVLAVVTFWPKPEPVVPTAAPVVRREISEEGYRRLALEDGSVVEMNAHSELRIAYVPAERRVELVRGEASFAVAKNKARPFLVTAGAVTVRAVGTAFNVRLAPSAVEVLVTEGRVKIEPKHPAKVPVVEAPLVGAGEKIVIASQPEKIEKPVVTRVTQDSIQRELGWQTDWIRFDATPLAQAVAAFNLRNPVRLELADPRLGELKVDGGFRAENVDAFVHLLELNGGVVADRSVAGRIVLRRSSTAQP